MQSRTIRLRVGAAGVAVADIGGEEFDEALLCTAAGGGDQGRRRPDGEMSRFMPLQPSSTIAGATRWSGLRFEFCSSLSLGSLMEPFCPRVNCMGS
jgi:hypothetical protein